MLSKIVLFMGTLLFFVLVWMTMWIADLAGTQRPQVGFVEILLRIRVCFTNVFYLSELKYDLAFRRVGKN